MQIKHLVSVKNCLLCVFYTKTSCWQYSILLDDGSRFSPPEIYYTSHAAYRVGLNAITTKL